MWNLKKSGTDESICSAGLETQTWRTDVGWEGGMWDELGD